MIELGTQMYTKFGYSSPAPRLHHACCAVDEKLWIYGGLSIGKTCKYLNDIWTYSFDQSVWTRVTFTSNVEKGTSFSPHALAYQTMTPVFSSKVFSPDGTFQSFNPSRFDKLNVSYSKKRN